MAAYNAAKAGVHLLTKSVALHAARKKYGVRCNSVHPTFVDTGMVDGLARGGDAGEIRARLAAQVPLGRIGTVDDVAWAVIYLASEESAFMTGAEIKLDGGLSAM
jgi:NAD(P)-dependent dehydrogenase (short-subunit alcohol dehydrogenase family)